MSLVFVISPPRAGLDAASAHDGCALRDFHASGAALDHAYRASRRLRQRREGALRSHQRGRGRRRRSSKGCPKGSRTTSTLCGRIPNTLYGRMLSTSESELLPRQDACERTRAAIPAAPLSGREVRRAHPASVRGIQLVREQLLQWGLAGRARLQSDPRTIRAGHGDVLAGPTGSFAACRLRGPGDATRSAARAHLRVPRSSSTSRTRSSTARRGP